MSNHTYTLNFKHWHNVLPYMSTDDLIYDSNSKDFRARPPYNYREAWREFVANWRWETGNTHTVAVPELLQHYKGDKEALLVEILNSELDSITKIVESIVEDLSEGVDLLVYK